MADSDMSKEQFGENFQPIEFDNSFNVTGEEIQTMKKTPAPSVSGMSGSVLDNLGAKSPYTRDSWSIAVQEGLSNDEIRDRIEAKDQLFLKRVGRKVLSLWRSNTDPAIIERELSELRDIRSELVESGRLTPAQSRIKK